jgi:hypothetical protein
MLKIIHPVAGALELLTERSGGACTNDLAGEMS